MPFGTNDISDHTAIVTRKLFWECRSLCLYASVWMHRYVVAAAQQLLVHAENGLHLPMIISDLIAQHLHVYDHG